MQKKFKITLLITVLAISSLAVTTVYSRKGGKPVKIGVISANADDEFTDRIVLDDIARVDINNYLRKIPWYRFNARLRLQFVFTNADGSLEGHQAALEELHSQGIKIIIGAPWSSMAQSSLDYINEHDILMISASSTSQSVAIPDDNLFRLCPVDTTAGPVIASMMSSQGVDAVLIIRLDIDWSSDLVDSFFDVFTEMGGTVPYEIAYDGDTSDFTSILDALETAAIDAQANYGVGNVGVLFLGFNEASSILGSAYTYPTIGSMTWYGADGTAQNQFILDDIPTEAIALKLYSTLLAPSDSVKYEEMATRFEDLSGSRFVYYSATKLDIAWILTDAILQTKRSWGWQQPDPMSIKLILPDVASRHYGYSGWCVLNDAGDRTYANYNIWGYGYVDGDPSFVLYGYYDAATDSLNWFK